MRYSLQIYRVAQKSKPQIFVHMFVKYRPILRIFSLAHSWKICNKVVTKHTTTSTLTASLHYLVKYEICKIHHYLVNV